MIRRRSYLEKIQMPLLVEVKKHMPLQIAIGNTQSKVWAIKSEIPHPARAFNH